MLFNSSMWGASLISGQLGLVSECPKSVSRDGGTSPKNEAFKHRVLFPRRQLLKASVDTN